MGLFDVTLLDTDQVFQKLLSDALTTVTVVADVDADSYAAMPLLTHSSLASQDGNANGLWDVSLTLSLSADVSHAFSLASEVYQTVWFWDDPTKGIVPNIGAVERVEDISAMSRVGGAVQLNAKTLVQYTGSWRLSVRNF